MPVLRVDDDVWSWLKNQATPFEDTPNSVLRRVAGLDNKTRSSETIRSPNSSKSVRHNPVNDYVVTKSPDRHAHWWFQIYKRKLDRKAQRGDFDVVVICDRKAPSQIVFRVPYSFLEENVLDRAKLEPDRRYMFEVRKDSLEFVFHPGIRFAGKPFLVKS